MSAVDTSILSAVDSSALASPLSGADTSYGDSFEEELTLENMDGDARAMLLAKIAGDRRGIPVTGVRIIPCTPRINPSAPPLDQNTG